MDISGTKEIGKFSNSENVDIDVSRFLVYIAALNDGLHNWVLH